MSEIPDFEMIKRIVIDDLPPAYSLQDVQLTFGKLGDVTVRKNQFTVKILLKVKDPILELNSKFSLYPIQMKIRERYGADDVYIDVVSNE